MTDQELDELRSSSARENESRFFKFPPDHNQPQSEEISENLTLFKNKMKDGKRAIVRLKRQREDVQLDSLLGELLVLECHLRKEQCQILSQLETRDATITAQRQEIERLRRDNRRLISRLKKITEGRDARDDRAPPSAAEPQLEEYKAKKSSSSRSTSKRSPQQQQQQLQQPPLQMYPNRPFAKHSVMTTLTSQFYEKTALQFTDASGKIVNRVLHKPPIAEKPKLYVSRPSQHHQQQPVAALVRSQNGQCSIVSTISRLLDEESDQGINASSGSSEPSSPEATLKPTTPRVIRLARQYEKGIGIGTGGSSSESGRSGDEQSDGKALIMDEHEVTSGYNSDAVSDQDHDYENVILYKGKVDSPSEETKGDLEGQPLGPEEHYVILRAVPSGYETAAIVEGSDDHIYSNVEYGPKDALKEVCCAEDAKEALLRQLLETNVDDSDCLSDGPEMCDSLNPAKNAPRSRQNIDLVMGAGESRLMENFEEFSLDSLDLEEDLNQEGHSGKENLPLQPPHLRHSGDGAESKNSSSKEQREKGQGGYERFLEATGLSQKSILTPSRMFSNHRSMLKPRDIKHRDKLRAAFTSLSTLEEVASPSLSPSLSSPSLSSHNGNTSQAQSPSSQRYWREPYL